jgi:hypothetical protein
MSSDNGIAQLPASDDDGEPATDNQKATVKAIKNNIAAHDELGKKKAMLNDIDPDKMTKGQAKQFIQENAVGLKK